MVLRERGRKCRYDNDDDGDDANNNNNNNLSYLQAVQNVVLGRTKTKEEADDENHRRGRLDKNDTNLASSGVKLGGAMDYDVEAPSGSTNDIVAIKEEVSGTSLHSSSSCDMLDLSG